MAVISPTKPSPQLWVSVTLAGSLWISSIITPLEVVFICQYTWKTINVYQNILGEPRCQFFCALSRVPKWEGADAISRSVKALATLTVWVWFLELTLGEENTNSMNAHTQVFTHMWKVKINEDDRVRFLEGHLGITDSRSEGEVTVISGWGSMPHVYRDIGLKYGITAVSRRE